jgi:hypothetical protein
MIGIDYEEVLDNLGIEYDTRGVEALALCPMHFKLTGKEDHSPSWSLNMETGQHMCFSCGYKGNLLQLVADVNGFYLPPVWGVIEEQRDYQAAENWLGSMTEVSPDRLAEALRRIPNRVEQLPPPPPMNEARLVMFTAPPQKQLDARRISAEAAAAYEILWDPKTLSWILVIREPEGKLMGWQEKGTVERTFKNRPPGISKKDALFGYKNLREDVVYLVESPLDCARFYTAGFPGAVAICGSAMSEAQVKLVSGASRVIAAFDNAATDPAGKKASAGLSELALRYGLNLSFFNYGDSGAKDPGDLSDEQIAWGIENAKSFLFGEQAYV